MLLILVILVIFVKSTNKICICNNKQSYGCPNDCYSIKSFQFEYYKHKENMIKEEEIDIYFYSDQKYFEFEIEATFFSGVNLTLFVYPTSTPIKIKYKYPDESKNKIISLDPNYQIIFPNLIPSLSKSSEKNIKTTPEPIPPLPLIQYLFLFLLIK